eukprot:1184029-Prorocentrum_minimum.AAC.1
MGRAQSYTVTDLGYVPNSRVESHLNSSIVCCTHRRPRGRLRASARLRSARARGGGGARLGLRRDACLRAGGGELSARLEGGVLVGIGAEAVRGERVLRRLRLRHHRRDG